MSSYRVISSDNHVFEPTDLWTSRGESKFKDRLPHVVSWKRATGGFATAGKYKISLREPRSESDLKIRKS